MEIIFANKERKPEFDQNLQCSWEKVTFLDETQLAIDFPENNCCDMKGMIAFASALNPKVKLIQTFSGGKQDVAYVMLDDGFWVARDLSKH